MRCETAKKCLSDDLDGALTAKRKSRLEFHLRSCSRCRTYQAEMLRLQGESQGLGDPGLSAEYWSDFNRRLESRLETAERPEAREKTLHFFRWRWAWAAASFLILASVGGYFAFLRPRDGPEQAFVSVEDSLSQIVAEVGANPSLENSFNQEILASIADMVLPPDEEITVALGDNPLIWESLTEGELTYIESELKKEQGSGGLS